MTIVLQVGDQTITETEIVPLLAQYQLLPQLLREIVIDQAIVPFSCTPQEQVEAFQSLCAQQQINSDAALQAWLTERGLTLEQMKYLAVRNLRIEKFKQTIWAEKVDSYFLSRKHQLDRVIYSLLRVKDDGIVQELYFRLEAGEQSFAEVAQTYSQGPEAQTQGITGPIELSKIHPLLAQLLTTSQPSQLRPPIKIEDWFVIVRLEKMLPAQMDEPMRQRLLQELFVNWLQEQINQLSIKA